MAERLDALLTRWVVAFAAADVGSLIDIYRVDGALLWSPYTEATVYGHGALEEFFAGFLDGVSETEASYGPSIGCDGSRCGAAFCVRRDAEVFEGYGFFLMSVSGFLELDRRFPGPTTRAAVNAQIGIPT